jgi:hypothetical protein
MNLFRQSRPATSPAVIQQVKTWVYEALALPRETPISVSQLQCHEPGCPPIETVIAVMSQPPQTYKIHAAIADLNAATITQALQTAPASSESS